MFGRRRAMQAETRNERLFAAAIRNFQIEVKAIFARHSADGLLKSGKTVRVVVRAADNATLEAIDDALAGIASVTEHAGRERANLVAILSAALSLHQAEIVIRAQQELARVGLGNDFKHARSLIDEANARQAEKLVDFQEGWTAPPGKAWKDRHPILFAVVIAAIGLAVGWIGKTLIDSRSETPANSALDNHIGQNIAM